VGNGGTMLVTQNRGAAWTSQASGTVNDLQGVSCAQTTICLAAGSYGTAVITLDGSSWSAVTMPNRNFLRAAALPDVNHAWVAGFGGTILANPTITPLCASASISTNPYGLVAQAGTTVIITAGSTGCPNPRYRFWIKDPPVSNWSMVQDYSAATTYTWTQTSREGPYYIEVDARDQTSTDSYDAVANTQMTMVGAPACATASLSTNPAPPQPGGTQVILTASSTGCNNPRYQFWLQDPGSRWSMVQDYSATTTYTWAAGNNKAPGTYNLQVYARDSSSSDTYQAVSPITHYQMNPAAMCTAAKLSASPVSPGATGVTVTLTGYVPATCNPTFRFWIQDPGRAWSMVQDYSPAMAYTWTQTGLAGSYKLEVDVRDANSSVAYDTVNNITYDVKGCSAAGLSANPTTAAHGTAITLTATATCLGTPNYKFWVQTPDGAWTVVRDYGTSNTYLWTPATAGAYHLEVDVRNQGGTDTYETVKTIPYTVT
jgi:hypothetical protein